MVSDNGDKLLAQGVPELVVDSNKKLLDLMAQCAVFHQLDSNYWDSLLDEAVTELNSITFAAVSDNYLGGLTSPEYQITVITLSNRVELLRAFQSAVIDREHNPVGDI